MLLNRFIAFCSVLYLCEGSRKCPDASKAHLTRCDMYYKCVTMPSENHVWIPANCPKGLVYETTWKMCVLPGDDWECHLGENETQTMNDDADNVYGVKNLVYLQQQLTGYDADINHEVSEEDGELSDDNDSILLATTSTGTANQTSDYIITATNATAQYESSGDGDVDVDETENKSEYVPISMNSNRNGLVVSHLQRLSQLINSMSNQHNETNFELGPDDLNQVLALHRIKFENEQTHNYVSNVNTEPMPTDGIIDAPHLQNILDLQKKLNNFGITRDTYSTPATPVTYAVSGNAAYPPDTTALHIKATNGIKTLPIRGNGYSTSQVIVNRPGGSVMLNLPNANYRPSLADRNKNENQISEETLQMLLELSKHMTTPNQIANTPTFVHSLSAPTNAYSAQPQFQPFSYYKNPWNSYPMSSLLAALDSEKVNQIQDEDQSMEKISSVSGVVPTHTYMVSGADDIEPSTIIHNHIPITISNPSPTNSIVNRFHATSTTERPSIQDQYDSYGNKRPNQHTHYYTYPPYNDEINQNRPSNAYTISYNFHQNADQRPIETPQYVKISQSQPDPYGPFNVGVVQPQRPVPTYSSIDTNYGQTIHTPSPHLNDNNVNSYVNIDRKQYPTLQPINYVPITSSSNTNPSYVGSPATYLQNSHNYPNVIDKLDHDLTKSSENNDQNDSDQSDDNVDDIVEDGDDGDDGDDDDDSDDSDGDDEYTNSNQKQNNANDNSASMLSLLANYNAQTKPHLTSGNNVVKKPEFEYNPIQSDNNHKQFVNLGGNFMSLESYKQSIEPFLQGNTLLGSEIEVLTCSTGVRQANSSDCTRYFVCNAKTGKIFSYACPPYTAFNAGTKICTAQTYSECFPGAIKNKITITENKRIQQQAQQSLLEANRIRTEAIKAQKLAQMIKLETDKILSSAAGQMNKIKKRLPIGVGKATSAPTSPTTSPLHNSLKRPYHNQNPTKRKPQRQTTTKKQQIQQKQPTKNTQQLQKAKGKRKIPCRTEGKLPDQLSKFNYFLCFKGKDGKMRARKLQCPANLAFCSTTLMCTSAERCMNKFNRL